MRILVTGGSGFIGKALVRKLIGQGHEVRAFSRRPETLLQDGFAGVIPIPGDLADPAGVKNAVKDCDRVFHLGALARAWSPRPDDFDRANVIGTRNLLEACREANVGRILHTSTVMAIGPTDGFVADESTPLSNVPLSDYQRTKRSAEILAMEAFQSGVPVVIASPSLVYGPAAGERRVSFNRFLQDFIRGRPVVIPGDGSQVINCVYLDDVVEGLLLAMERGRSGEKYILGGENTSVRDLSRLVNRLTGTTRRICHVPFWIARLAGLMETARARWTGATPLLTWSSVETYRHSWAYSSKKAARELGYRARTMEEGLPATIAWLKNLA